MAERCDIACLEQVQEDAAGYALGLLDPGEAAHVEQRLAAGCPVCNAEVRAFEEVAAVAMEAAAPMRAPSAGLRSQLLGRIADEAAGQGMVSIRAGEGRWEPVVPGIDRKMLYMDRAADSVTYLLRMEPRSVLPAHEHGGVEQCMILSGTLTVDEETFGSGDFQWLAEHSTHHPIRSEEGCTVLIVAAHPRQTRILA